MYPQVNVNQMPSAPPPYSESENAQKYMGAPNYPQYPPPPPGFQLPTQVIVVEAPGLPPLGKRSVEVTCPSCKTVVMTCINEEASNAAYFCCMLMFVVGCFVCSCLPFCMNNFQLYKHSCPRCTAYIGTYQPS